MPSSEYTRSHLAPSVSRYSSVAPLQKGAMFVVSTANNDGRKWLLKSISPKANGEQEKLRLILQREYTILQQLDSPYIIRAREMVTADELGLCLVEEYVEGETLDVWLQHRPSCTQRRKVLEELLEVVEYIHSKQIIHGDLKPQNILITTNGQHVKLIDFGLSDESGTIDKNIGCTKQYAAPEQTISQPTDCRTDVYAVGHLLKILFPCRYAFIRKKCLRTEQSRRYASVRAIARNIHWNTTVWKVSLLLVAFAVIWQGAIWGFEYRTHQQISSAQRQQEAVIDALHQSYYAICAIYRDSLQASPSDSILIRVRAMEQIKAFHDQAMQRDSVHADAIDKDYFRNYTHFYDQLYFPKQ